MTMGRFKYKNLSLRPLGQYLDLFPLWRRMEREGLLDTFCTVETPDMWGVDGWWRKIFAGNVTLLQIEYEFRPLGFIHIENIHGRRAQVHFMLFDCSRRLCVEGGPYALAKIMDRFNLNVLYGIIPAVNSMAVKFARAIGGKVTGSIPGGSYIARTKTNVDSIIVTFNRGGN